jgi:hypothetical protein
LWFRRPKSKGLFLFRHWEFYFPSYRDFYFPRFWEFSLPFPAHRPASRTAGGEEKKPRTYRERARRDYLRAAKRRRLGGRELHKAIGKQLRYLRRDLEHIEALAEKSCLELLSRREYRNLLVIGEVYRQQKQMYEERSRRIDDRIVRISQPHVRPIVRGKTGVPAAVWVLP